MTDRATYFVVVEVSSNLRRGIISFLDLPSAEEERDKRNDRAKEGITYEVEEILNPSLSVEVNE